MRASMKWWMLSSMLLLAACDRIPGNMGLDKETAAPPAKNCDALFARVQPRLDFCRTCHVPGGLSDTPEGNQFMLSTNTGEDFNNLRESWIRLGRNDSGTSRILLMAAGVDPTESHSGGAPWPQGSAEYNDAAALLAGFVDPSACKLDNGGTSAGDFPLLGSKHARHLWATYCADRPDDAVLPADPRTLIQPGANEGLAVYYNAYWQDCHANAPEAEKQAKTCGEYRTRRDRGLHFLMDELPSGAMSADDYNNSWKAWGLPGRPENFDQLYTLRYGYNQAAYRNPYPLPGEDPNATDGGSGQLPMGLRQGKDADGKWTGQIGTGACFQCHGGQIGDPFNGEQTATLESIGIGNSNFDVIMSGHDNSPYASVPVLNALPALDINTLFNIGIKQRGQNNAVGAFELLNTLLDVDSLGLNPVPVKMFVNPANPLAGILDVSHPLAHTQDTPAWWNMGSRPRKFFDAGVSNDSTRIIMAAGPGEFNNLVSTNGIGYRTRVEQYDQDLEAFFLSLHSPDYPREIDTKLAEQGAILFHTKNLWGGQDNKDRPKPLGGNGSCASCHGAYSPRFVHDPTYLQTPDLEGVAGHISPLDVIGTDTARSDMLTPTLRLQWDTTWWGYPEGMPGYTYPADKNPVVELADDMSPLRPVGLCGWQKDTIGYQAPPLYGVWATAPYLHNGSVPTIEALLDSSKRAPIWRRQLQTVDGVTGFDQRLGEAYDFTAMGWKSDALSCKDIPGNQLLNCNPLNDQGPSLVQIAQNIINGEISYLGLATVPDPTPGAIDKRLVFDTRTLGNSNAGHEFTDVLTEQERRAIIEYLKTL